MNNKTRLLTMENGIQLWISEAEYDEISRFYTPKPKGVLIKLEDGNYISTNFIESIYTKEDIDNPIKI